MDRTYRGSGTSVRPSIRLGVPTYNRRYLIDALRATDPEQGHRAVAAYRMEDDIGQLRAPTLVIAHAQDPYAAPEAPRLASALADAQMVTIEDGMVPLEFTAPAFAAYTRDHLLGVDAASAA